MKKFLTLFILFVLGVGVYFGYKAWKNPGTIPDNLLPPDGNMENWENYENKTWGFSFKYPSDWTLEEVTARTDSDFLSLTLKKEDTSQDKIEVYTEEMYPVYSIQVMARKNTEGWSAMEEYTHQFINPADVDVEEVTYGGLEGVKYNEPVAPSSGLNPAVMLASDTTLYNFVHSGLATTTTHSKYFDTFEKVLKSLKFE